MRLNLPNYHCVQFELTSRFAVDKEKNDEIDAFMDLTHTHDPEPGDEGGSRVALFGARTKNRGINHRMQGRLVKTPSSEELRILLSVSSSRASDQLGPPPRDFRPVSFLVESAAALFGTTRVSCRAVFNYDEEVRYKSKIALPIPLMIQDGQGGVTHLESIQFSRREGDRVDYTVIVGINDDPHLIVHSLDFDSTIEWNIRSVREIFNKARLASQQLLIREGER